VSQAAPRPCGRRGGKPRYVDVAHSLRPTFLQAGVATLRAMTQHAAAIYGSKRMAYRKAIILPGAVRLSRTAPVCRLQDPAGGGRKKRSCFGLLT